MRLDEFSDGLMSAIVMSAIDSLPRSDPEHEDLFSAYYHVENPIFSHSYSVRVGRTPQILHPESNRLRSNLSSVSSLAARIEIHPS